MFLMPAVYMFSRFIFEKANTVKINEREKMVDKELEVFWDYRHNNFPRGVLHKRRLEFRGVFEKSDYETAWMPRKNCDYISNEDVCYFIGSIRISSAKIRCDSQIVLLALKTNIASSKLV